MTKTFYAALLLAGQAVSHSGVSKIVVDGVELVIPLHFSTFTKENKQIPSMGCSN
jgi:hypothetical protein